MMMSKQIITSICAILWCTGTQTLGPITPFFSIRSQGLDTPRHISGEIQQIYAINSNTIYGTLSAALEYQRSFRHEQITESLFGTKSCPTITISGSRIADRGANDWLADYFYLPTDFKSTVNFKPVVDNIILDLNFFIGLDDWVNGLYLALYGPLVHTRWHLNMCETVDMYGTNTMIPGYFTPAALDRNELLDNFTEYINGTLIGPVEQTVGGTKYTITFDQLRYGRMSSSRLTQTRFADIRLEIGYDCIRNDRFCIGFGGYVSLPTGNRPQGEYLFEPIIGNAHHWELGGIFHTWAKCYRSEDQSKEVIFYLNALLDHLFSARQKRTLDLIDKPFSRYMLAERFSDTIQNNLKGDGTKPSAQFFNEFTPIANLTRLSVDSTIGIQAEITAVFTFVCDHFSWDIGYNFWYTSCESLQLRGINPFVNPPSKCQWALKGDAMVFGFDRGAAGDALVGAVPLSATESVATIYSGTNFTAMDQSITNAGIDNPQAASGDASSGSANNPLSASPTTQIAPIQTSIEPILLRGSDIDVCNLGTRGLSNKAFTHFSYAWNERESWIPYVGIGGEVEFAQRNISCKPNCCPNQCVPCGVSQWGIWIKGGLTY